MTRLRGKKSRPSPVPSAHHAWWQRTWYLLWGTVLVLIMPPSQQYIHTGIGLPLKDVGLEQSVGKPFEMLFRKPNVWTNVKARLRCLMLGNICLTRVQLSFWAVACYLLPTLPSSQYLRLLQPQLQPLLPLQPQRCLVQQPTCCQASLPPRFQTPLQPQ